jgi:acetyltransferase-like isoleucine patch superfamily enzyme
MDPKIYKASIQDVIFGRDVRIVEPVNLYGCSIGDGCFIGPFTEIQKGAVIGNRSRVQSHAFICDLVTIGEDCFVGHGVVFINDLFQEGGPAGGDRTKYKSTKIGNSVSIGSNATILAVTIADHTVIGAGSVVTKDILVAGIYAGNPAKLIRTIPKK